MLRQALRTWCIVFADTRGVMHNVKSSFFTCCKAKPMDTLQMDPYPYKPTLPSRVCGTRMPQMLPSFIRTCLYPIQPSLPTYWYTQSLLPSLLCIAFSMPASPLLSSQSSLIQSSSYTCSAPHPASASLIFAGGSILGTNSSAQYARPMSATSTPGTYWNQSPPAMTQPMKT